MGESLTSLVFPPSIRHLLRSSPSTTPGGSLMRSSAGKQPPGLTAVWCFAVTSSSETVFPQREEEPSAGGAVLSGFACVVSAHRGHLSSSSSSSTAVCNMSSGFTPDFFLLQKAKEILTDSNIPHGNCVICLYDFKVRRLCTYNRFYSLFSFHQWPILIFKSK